MTIKLLVAILFLMNVFNPSALDTNDVDKAFNAIYDVMEMLNHNDELMSWALESTGD